MIFLDPFFSWIDIIDAFILLGIGAVATIALIIWTLIEEDNEDE